MKPQNPNSSSLSWAQILWFGTKIRKNTPFLLITETSHVWTGISALPQANQKPPKALETYLIPRWQSQEYWSEPWCYCWAPGKSSKSGDKSGNAPSAGRVLFYQLRTPHWVNIFPNPGFCYIKMQNSGTSSVKHWKPWNYLKIIFVTKSIALNDREILTKVTLLWTGSLRAWIKVPSCWKVQSST